MKDNLVAVAFATALVLIMGFGIWAHFAAPCGIYKFSRVGDVPARCLTVVRK